METKNSLITTKDGIPFEVTPEGSLGLLALGYIGIRVWREERNKQRLAADKVLPK